LQGLSEKYPGGNSLAYQCYFQVGKKMGQTELEIFYRYAYRV